MVRRANLHEEAIALLKKTQDALVRAYTEHDAPCRDEFDEVKAFLLRAEVKP